LTFAHPSVIRRRLLLVPAVTIALTTAACGGGSSVGSAHGSDMTSTSGSAQTAPASSSASGASSSRMAGMATYPPVTPGPAAAGAKNDIDIMFANDMIPHHGQAVQMADMILAKTSNPQVKALAERIKAAQSPEIAAMTGWLKGWGATPPDPYAHVARMAGMQHGGMMTAEQMDQLDKATGSAADKLFLTQMQEHHTGAIEMAKGELDSGTNPAAKKLAQAILTSQTAEIAQMKTMVTALG
jgi:uncharacterized protein (DUF305 family)